MRYVFSSRAKPPTRQPKVRPDDRHQALRCADPVNLRRALPEWPLKRVRLQRAAAFFFAGTLGLFLIGLEQTASAQTKYRVEAIPLQSGANSAALGLNDNGEVVGYSYQGEQYEAFLYSHQKKSLQNLGTLGGKTNAACAINSRGYVSGYSQDGNGNLFAFLYTPGKGLTSLGSLEGGSGSEAFAINNSNQVAGDSQTSADSHHAVYFVDSQGKDLGIHGGQNNDALRTAYGISDTGEIVGRTDLSDNSIHAFSYSLSTGQMADLGTLGGANSEALAVNRGGTTVGDSDTSNGPAHAFVKLANASGMTDLGVLPGFDKSSFARAVNEQNVIVGESDSDSQKHAFVYQNATMTDLNSVASNVREAGFASLDVAYGINQKGWIVGYGTTTDGRTGAFLAIPEESAGNASVANAADVKTTDYSVFYNQLSDDGNWVDAGSYGYCFHPKVKSDWRPYRDGHWARTDRGWYWYSDERFGWATYHYGRWARVSDVGWCWVPGREWAPAWVSWRQSDDYVGWAPLPPAAPDPEPGVSIGGWCDTHYDVGPSAYAFIPYNRWGAPSYAAYVLPPERNVTIINVTRNITNINVNNRVVNNFGPPVNVISQRTGQNIPINQLQFNTNGRNFGNRLNGNQLQVVSPAQTLQNVSAIRPVAATTIAKPTLDTGWKGVNAAQTAKLRQTIAQQNPVPANVTKTATAVATPTFTGTASQRGGFGANAAVTPPAVGGKTPVVGATPGVAVKPGTTPVVGATPATGIKPGATPNTAIKATTTPVVGAKPGTTPALGAGNKTNVPPNLLGPKGAVKTTPANAVSTQNKPSATNLVKQAVTPGASAAVRSSTAPPNLLGPKGVSTPATNFAKPATNPNGARPNATPAPTVAQAVSTPTTARPNVAPTAAPVVKTTPVGQPTPVVRNTPAVVSTPAVSKTVAPAATPVKTPASTPAPVATPARTPATVAKTPAAVATPVRTPAAESTPARTPAVSKTPVHTATPQVQHQTAPQAAHTPAARAHHEATSVAATRNPAPHVQTLQSQQHVQPHVQQSVQHAPQPVQQHVQQPVQQHAPQQAPQKKTQPKAAGTPKK